MSCFSRGEGSMKGSDLTECLIELLDGTAYSAKIKGQSKGQHLMDNVCSYLNIAEKDYFGLRFLDRSKISHWVDLQKGLLKQVKRHSLNLNSVKFYLSVKFYATDPCKLKEEITRYQFFLQLKRDVLTGRIPIAFDNLVELCALVVQSELGDYDPTTHTSGYVSELRLAPQQTEELEQNIASAHQKLVGFHPSACEYMYLDKVKWQDMYGVDMHLVKGAGNTEYCIGLTPSGVAIYRHKTKVGIYYWPRITGITFKGKKFSLKVQDKIGLDTSYYFTFNTKELCKNLWKSCVEHHAFFRLSQAEVDSNPINNFFQLGSKFRYSGRTEKELAASEPPRSPQPVRRTKSQRHERRQLKPDSSSIKNTVTSPSSNVAGIVPQPVNSLDRVNCSTLTKTNTDSRTVSMLPAQSKAAERRSPPSRHKPNNASSRQPSSQTNNISGDINIGAGTRMVDTRIDLSWITQGGGLFTSSKESPKSVRSDKMRFPSKHGRTDSGSEADSSYTRRSKTVDSPEDGCPPYHSNHTGYTRRESDNESEWSAMSRRRRRRYHRGNDSGSDAESIHRRRHKRSPHCQEDGSFRFRAGSVCSAVSAPASEMKHSKSSGRYYRDSANKYSMSDELLKYFNFKLMETNGMTGDQLKDIAYTSVQVPDHNDKQYISANDSYEARSVDVPQPRARGPVNTPVSLSRTSSSSYENILYDHTGSASIIQEEKATDNQHVSDHSSDYAIILPPPKFDNSTDFACSGGNCLSNPHKSCDKENSRSYSSPVIPSKYPNGFPPEDNRTQPVFQPNYYPNKYQSVANGYLNTPTLSEAANQTDATENYNLHLKSNGNPYKNHSRTVTNHYNENRSGNTHVNVCERWNAADGTSSTQEQWVDTLNVFKHTDHQNIPKVTHTGSSIQDSQQTNTRPAKPNARYHQDNNNNPLTSNRYKVPTSLANQHQSSAKQHPMNGVHNAPLNGSFYAQYCNRRAVKTSASETKSSALKVSNI